MKYLLIAMLFTSCMTQKNAERWLNEHPTEAAGYCAATFPPDTTAQIVSSEPDSSGYKEAYESLSHLADSIFYRLDSLQHVPATIDKPCPPRVNLDSLRKVVDREIRKRLTPCVDSIQFVYTTVIDRAKERHLQGKLDEKDAVISARDKRITELEEKVKAKIKWVWMFWILVVAVGGYVFLKVKKVLPIILLVFFACCLDKVNVPEREVNDTLPVIQQPDTCQIIHN